MSNQILVTGATGFLGSNIVLELIKGNQRPKLFVRDPKKLDKRFSGLEIIVGDLRDKKLVETSMEGCNQVIHCAGFVSLYPKDHDLLYELNHRVSQNVFQGALNKKVEKLIYTSTSSCLGAYHSSDMTDKIEAIDLDVPYIQSKLLAMNEALNYYKRGLPVIILCPTLVLGEGDWKLTSSELVYRFLKREIPAYLEGGLNPIDVKDVALAHIKALEHGIPGEVYPIAGSKNFSIRDFFLELEKLSGIKAPKVKIPFWFAKILAFLNERLSRTPKITRAAVLMGHLYWFFDNRKMITDLHVTPRDTQRTLEKSIRWLKNEML
ncbi:MAG: dihydroflavonol-4-reductase [bacterium]|nr:MAG: dihydroflavonol-4-reductase [bacterium]